MSFHEKTEKEQVIPNFQYLKSKNIGCQRHPYLRVLIISGRFFKKKFHGRKEQMKGEHEKPVKRRRNCRAKATPLVISTNSCLYHLAHPKGTKIGHQRQSYLQVHIIFGQFLKKLCHGRKERTKGEHKKPGKRRRNRRAKATPLVVPNMCCSK